MAKSTCNIYNTKMNGKRVRYECFSATWWQKIKLQVLKCSFSLLQYFWAVFWYGCSPVINNIS